jgi:hypothetical protein
MHIKMVKKAMRAKSKLFLFITLLTLCASVVKAQAISEASRSEIAKSITKTVINKINYPDELRNNCIATFTNFMFKVDSSGVIKYLSISDNAPEDLKNAFQKYKNTLNLEGLQKLVSISSIKNCEFNVPVYYTFPADYCKTQFDVKFFKADSYYKYNGEYNNLPTFNLDPVIIIIYPSMK